MSEQQITVQDALWLNMDRPNNLMIIDSVMWFVQEPDWQAVRKVISERMIARYPVFSSKAVKRKDGQFWVSDDSFDLDNHLIFPDLPSPVSSDALRGYLEAQRSRPLERDKPLWEFHFIPRATSKQGVEMSVIMTRFHHSIADGVRLTQLVLGLCDPIDGDAGVAAAVGKGRNLDGRSGGGPVAKVSGAVSGAVSGLTGRATAAGTQVVGAAKATMGVAAEGGSAAAAALSQKAKQAVSDPVTTLKSLPGAVSSIPQQVTGVARSGQAMFDDALDVVGDPGKLADAFTAMIPVPEDATNTAVSVAKLAFSPASVQTVWSGTPGVDKRLNAVDAFRLDRVKEVGKRTGTTVNDVLLAVVAGTLRRYLAEQGASVAEVMWMIPVSLKPFDGTMPKELGNHFALIALQMPLDIDDPLERLREINRRINKIKKSHEAVVTFGVQRVVATSPEDISVFLTNWFANKAVGILTNVPGPRSQIALAGTPVEGMLGFAPSSGDQPMTVTIFSYNDRVHIGFGTDATLVPNPQRLPELFIEEAIALYTAVTGKRIARDDVPTVQ